VLNPSVPSGWRTERVRAGELTLAAFRTGSAEAGAPVVLLLHGLGHWTDAAWGRLVPRLDPALRYVAFDLPGFGASDKPRAPYDAAYFRGVMERAVDALKLERFALVGHSLGGYIAADYAGAHPERVARLALIAPAGFARSARHLAYGVAGTLAPGLFALAPSKRIVARALTGGVFDPSSIDAATLERAYELAQEPALRKAFAGVYSGGLRGFPHLRTRRAGFARYTGPVFCAWGKHDRYIPIRALRAVQTVYPHATTLVLDRSAHLPMIEEPQTLAAALRPFLVSA
jgi:pimeloyl-ACP methyl ester carboxylesterase